MKKTLILLCAAALCAACTVDKSNNSGRTSDNLDDLAYSIATWTTDGVVRLMNEYALNESVDLFEVGFDRTAKTPHEIDVRITKDSSEDSLWTISTADPASIIRFDAQLKMLPSDPKEKETDIERHRWRLSDLVGQYLEPGGKGADFRSTEPLEFWWYRAYISFYDGFAYMLTKKGTFRIETFAGSTPLHWCQIKFSGEDQGLRFSSGPRE